MAGITEILDLADGGGIIVVTQGGEEQVVSLPPSNAVQRTQAKRAFGDFLRGAGRGSPFLRPDGQGNLRLQLSVA